MLRRIGWALPGLAVLVLAALAPQGAGAATNWAAGLAANSAGRALGGTPGAPSTVAATCHSALGSQIDVAWTALRAATKYTVFQSIGGAAYTQVATVTTNQWSSGANVTISTYAYKIQASFGANWVGPQSAASNTRSVVIGLVCL